MPQDLPPLDLFNLPPEAALRPLHAHAPVWQLQVPGRSGTAVLKRTARTSGEAVAAWSGALRDAGVGVVAPERAFSPNPRTRVTSDGEERWVIYPFVEGRPYTGAPREIRSAGRLLGQIHAFEAERDFGLNEHASARAFPRESLAMDAEVIVEHVRQAFPEQAGRVEGLLLERTERYLQAALPRVQGEALPLVNCSWDHKAANLVYVTPDAPVLIDPDNAARLPRVYDLAITALSFPLDGTLHRGPQRLWTPEEWQRFLAGYLEFVTFTPAERACWADVLLCAWMDESLWQLQDSADAWQAPAQAPLLLELALLDAPFRLPAGGGRAS